MSKHFGYNRVATVDVLPMFATLIRFLGKSAVPIVQRNPLLWALPLQAVLLLSNLNLLDPWNDEWFTLTHIAQPLGQVAFEDPMNPPFYYVLLHYWIQLPWSVSSLASVRAMSAVWALIATVVIYVLLLRREAPRIQATFPVLWVLSPCLVLHARMARSYSMQLTLASLAILSALRWAQRPRNWKWFCAYLGSSVALLYTHYLSALAVTAGVFGTLLLRKRFALVAIQAAFLAAFFAPWLARFISSLNWWASAPQSYEGGNVIADQVARLAYLFLSFSFGETFSTANVLMSMALAPVVAYALWRGLENRPAWLPIVLVATGIAWLGVSRFEQFVFMPAHLLFLLPFFLILVVRQLNWLAIAMLLIIYVGADYAYFTESGFLVKPYAAPYKAMVEVILNNTSGEAAIVAVDGFGTFTEPLVRRLDRNITIISLDNQISAREVQEAARRGRVIWLWRRTQDISPGTFVTKLEQSLRKGHEVRRWQFVPYSLPERWARRLLLHGQNQPQYYYQLTKFL